MPYRLPTNRITSTGQLFSRPSRTDHTDNPILALEAGDSQIIRSKFAAPQQCSAREFAGYAVTFGALAALLAGTPQQVGAAEYTVGTHQAAIAAAQPQPQVWGTPPPPVVVAADIVRQFIVEPQDYTDLAAHVYGAPPESVPRPLLKTILAAPQQSDDPYALLWGPQPQGIDLPPPRTRVSAVEQLGIAYAKLWGPVPAPIVVLDSPIGRLLTTVAQQDHNQASRVWGRAPVVVAAIPISSFRFYSQAEFEPVQVGITFGQELATFTPPPAQIIGFEWIIRARRRKGR